MAGTKSIPRSMVESVGRVVRLIVARDFDGNQRRAAKSLKISQTQISDLCAEKPGKGVGLPTLLALREYEKKSLDDLLGLVPLPAQVTPDLVNRILLAISEQQQGSIAQDNARPPKPRTSMARKNLGVGLVNMKARPTVAELNAVATEKPIKHPEAREETAGHRKKKEKDIA